MCYTVNTVLKLRLKLRLRLFRQQQTTRCFKFPGKTKLLLHLMHAFYQQKQQQQQQRQQQQQQRRWSRSSTEQTPHECEVSWKSESKNEQCDKVRKGSRATRLRRGEQVRGRIVGRGNRRGASSANKCMPSHAPHRSASDCQEPKFKWQQQPTRRSPRSRGRPTTTATRLGKCPTESF